VSFWIAPSDALVAKLGPRCGAQNRLRTGSIAVFGEEDLNVPCRGAFHPYSFASVVVVVPTTVLSRALSTPPLTNEP
jgi:hypothetical protein